MSSEVNNLMFLHVSVPPKPEYPPSLNGSGPYYLVVLVNKDPYTGDGPVNSVNVTYKPANSSTWETVEGSDLLSSLVHGFISASFNQTV